MLNSLFSYTNPNSFVNRLRKNRFKVVNDVINSLIEIKGTIKILDLGGDLEYWKNMNWNNHATQISLLNLSSNNIPDELKGSFQSIQADAANCPFSDNSFDLVFSNSTIEHMGSFENQRKFAEEVKRLAPNYIIQTPSIWFPLEPHCRIPFFQFIPHQIRAIILMIFKIHYFPKAKNYTDGIEASKTTMMMGLSRFKGFFPDSKIDIEFLWGIPKSYTAIRLNKE